VNSDLQNHVPLRSGSRLPIHHEIRDSIIQCTVLQSIRWFFSGLFLRERALLHLGQGHQARTSDSEGCLQLTLEIAGVVL
jgi:hypothetical protein